MANPNLNWLRGLLIFAAGFWVMSPAVHGDWLMDDNFYLWQNALLGDPHRLWKIWFSPGSQLDYYPVEATIQLLQWNLWHLDTLGYHLTNMVLHCVNALLVWRLLAKFNLRYSWLGGFLFAVHPVTAESVAWIAEFKNVLSLPPFLLAMCAWIDFDHHGRRRDFWLALGLFLVAMLCKVSPVMFPCVILLYGWWRRGRIVPGDFLDALPFAVISLTLGATAVVVGDWFHAAHLQGNALPHIGGIRTHLALAGEAIGFYFVVTLFPLNMLLVYPKWDIGAHSILSYLPWLLLVAMLGYFWQRRETWGRHAMLGVGFFLLNLLPVTDFVTVTSMEYTWVTDHYLYIPIIGLIGLAIAALECAEHRAALLQQRVLQVTTAVVLALLAMKSNIYAATFAGPEQLWTYTISHNPGSYIAYNNLGSVMLETGRIPAAIANYNRAIDLHPTMVEAHINLGLAYFQVGRIDDAIEEYEEALTYYPGSALAHTNLGNALLRKGRTQEAIEHYKEALKTDPRNDDALKNLEELHALPSPLPNGKE